MSRWFATRVFTVVAFAAASIGLIRVVYAVVPPFNTYDRWMNAVIPLDPAWAAALAAGGLAAASASCLLDAQRRAQRLVHRWDWYFVLVYLVAAWVLVAGFFEKGRSEPSFHVACLAVLAVTGCYLWETTLVRLAAGTIGRTIFWPKVFRTLPLNQFSGVFILVVVILTSLLLTLGASSAFLAATSSTVYSELYLTGWLSGEWLLKVALPTVTLTVVAVLCRDILAVTAAKEAAVEARLAEERFRAELVTNVTHDLRTPLTSIINYADLIGKHPAADPTLAEYSAVLSRKSERLRSLIGDLLEASRASAGSLPVRLAPIELTEIIAQVAGDADEALAARGLTWVGPPPRHQLVLTDGEHLWRILENLVGNVVKYARSGTCVHAELVEGPGRLAVRLTNLTDEPLALSAEQLTAQFVRGDVARHTEGSGLGLFISDRLARLIGASLVLAVDGDRFVATVDLPTLGSR
jgi:signal transduction histidine kinase